MAELGTPQPVGTTERSRRLQRPRPKMWGLRRTPWPRLFPWVPSIQPTLPAEGLWPSVMGLLNQDLRVERVEFLGSLAADPDIPDDLSDIDLDVLVSPPTSDRDFALSLPALLAPLAPIVVARTLMLEGFGYVYAAHLEGYSPIWPGRRRHPEGLTRRWARPAAEFRTPGEARICRPSGISSMAEPGEMVLASEPADLRAVGSRMTST